MDRIYRVAPLPPPRYISLVPGVSLLWALLAACTTPSESPEILGVYPGFGYYREETWLSITGRNFYPTVTIDGQKADAGSLNDGLELVLEGPVQRSLVARLNSVQSLEAVVPAGLEPGSYDLHLTTGAGGETVAEDAFTVTAVRADHLRLETTSAAYEAGEVAEVSIRLVDSAEQPVEQSLQIEILASSSATNPSLSFEESLGSQQKISGGISGWLDEDGSGVFRVLSESPDDIRFDLAPVQSESIDGASLVLSWSPGGLAGAELRWMGAEGPIDVEQVVAGTPLTLEVSLVDALGNVLLGETASVILFEQTTCGDWFETRTVTGLEQVPITLTTACESDSIKVYVGGSVVETPPFSVLPAAASHFDVVIPNSSVEAGTGLLPVLIEALDPYGNRVEDYETPIELYDSAGGLNTATGIGSATCSDFVAGQLLCSAQLLKASTANQLTVLGEDGISGTSSSFQVYPSTPVRLSVELPQASAAAAESFEVVLGMRDSWDNLVEFDALVEPVSWSDMTGTLLCEGVGPQEDLSWLYLCSVTHAILADVLEAQLTGLHGTSLGTISISNGALSRVDLQVAGPLTAGLSGELSLSAWDAWDNPYLLQADPVLDLSESTGTLSPSSVTLDASGTAVLSISMTRATGDAVIVASQNSTELGRSPSFQVDPGPMSTLAVEVPGWVELGQSGTAEITAMDAWNNVITSHNGSGSLQAQSGSCETAAISSFVDGVAEVEFTCSVPGLSEVMQASVASYSGASGPFDVVDFGCDPGPTADLSLDGQTQLLQCLIGGSATVQADASGSTASSRAIVFYHYHDGEGNWERSTSSSQSYTWEDTGPRRLEVVVVDADACGDSMDAVAWIGTDDGSPTGPVSVSVSDSTVANGATTVVTASVADCTGDPAVGTLNAWPDLGTLSLIPGGAGLQATLDSSGQVEFDWAFSAGYAAEATLNIGSESAFGSATVQVTGDAVRPQVVEVSPSGATDDASLITVTFSEAMRPATVTATEIQLNGPSGLVTTTLSLSSDGQTLSIVPQQTLPVGIYTLSLGLGLRDDAQGNRLDGTWSGTASAFEVDIGAVSQSLPAVIGCSTSTSLFTPDGDPGVGTEADEVQITMVSGTAPRWWWLTVEDSAGERVWSWRSEGGSFGVSWEGRSQDGLVVQPGDYLLSVRAVDEEGNIGDPCAMPVEVAEHVQAP